MASKLSVELIVGKKHIVDVTPELIARLFAEMEGDDQAKFFNEIHVIELEWTGTAGFVSQLQAIIESEYLTGDGKLIMQQIGEYADGE